MVRTLLSSLVLLIVIVAAGIAAEPVPVVVVAEPAPVAAAAPIAQLASGVPVAAGEAVMAGAEPLILSITGAPGSTLKLSPGGTLRVGTAEVAGGTAALVQLDAGAVEVDLPNKGVYHELHVLGEFSDTRVTGTLFVVERRAQRGDYTALISGRLNVKLRSQVAERLGGSNDGVDLVSRQGVGADASGLGAIDKLLARPSVAASATVKEQATDAAANGIPFDTVSDAVAGTVVAQDVDDNVAASVSTSVESAVNDSIVDAVTAAVITSTLGGAPAPSGPSALAGPPAPPTSP